MNLGAGNCLSNRYRLVEAIAIGGAPAWLAHDELLNRPVVVRTLTSADADDPRRRAAVRDAARAAAAVAHPHLTQILDFDDDQLPYLVTELADGPDLAERLTTGPLPWPAAVRMAAEVAAVLAAAHSAGVVHGDVRPATVRLTAAGVKLGVAGLSRWMGSSGTTTTSTPSADSVLSAASNSALSAADAVAANSDGSVEGAALASDDVYALGAVMYAALTGHLPVPGVAAPEVPGLPPAVAALCARCLAAPADRPSSQEAATLLRAAVRDRRRPIPSTRVTAVARVPQRPPHHVGLDGPTVRHPAKRGGIGVPTVRPPSAPPTRLPAAIADVSGGPASAARRATVPPTRRQPARLGARPTPSPTPSPTTEGPTRRDRRGPSTSASGSRASSRRGSVLRTGRVASRRSELDASPSRPVATRGRWRFGPLAGASTIGVAAAVLLVLALVGLPTVTPARGLAFWSSGAVIAAPADRVALPVGVAVPVREATETATDPESPDPSSPGTGPGTGSTGSGTSGRPAGGEPDGGPGPGEETGDGSASGNLPGTETGSGTTNPPGTGGEPGSGGGPGSGGEPGSGGGSGPGSGSGTTDPSGASDAPGPGDVSAPGDASAPGGPSSPECEPAGTTPPTTSPSLRTTAQPTTAPACGAPTSPERPGATTATRSDRSAHRPSGARAWWEWPDRIRRILRAFPAW